MDNIGAEVGQKMRSAIKAKLTELGCYVDDELPDYIMVMVANKRTKSQMNDDLQLFLSNKTSLFVDWLQIVLKKLKEITVTNPEIYKRVSKRKAADNLKQGIKVKKEKKEKSKTKKSKNKELSDAIISDMSEMKSLTDDLPVEASKLSEMRKIVIMQENKYNNSNNTNIEVVSEDTFDIPPLSEVTMSHDTELIEIEKKIKNVKSRLGMQVPSDSDDEDFINIKAEPEDLFPNEQSSNSKGKLENSSRKIKLLNYANSEVTDSTQGNNLKQKHEHPRIVFGHEANVKKQSVLQRLGKRPNEPTLAEQASKIKRISTSDTQKEDEKILGIGDKFKRDGIETRKVVVNKDTDRESDTPPPRESALKRLGVLSKVAVPHRESIEPDEEIITKEVPSIVKVKPRTLPPSKNQANKNLLLKAVAEAQRSVAQTPIVGTSIAKSDALFTKKYKEKAAQQQQEKLRKLSNKEKNKIKNILVQADRKNNKELCSDEDSLEYIPKPIKKNTANEILQYIPSSIGKSDCISEKPSENLDGKGNSEQTFIITLDGISKRPEHKASIQKSKSLELEKKVKIPEETKKRKSPSPIIFNSNPSPVTKTKQIPDKLPIVFSPPALKTKERCKYWPQCRQHDKCEFVHPSTPCKLFPQCKFGDKCLYIHPNCKFESSCTRKDCPYSHFSRTFNAASPSSPQMCRFFPNCNNGHCSFYHPKPCKYGKYCKNQLECNFLHRFSTKSNFTWRSTIKS